MKPQISHRPLGILLQDAAIVSNAQVELALQEQLVFHHLRIGEILTLHGWIKQETADFFAEEWFKLQEEQARQPLGYYLEVAGLLNQQQVEAILKEQVSMGVRFGAIAVLKGWLKQRTVDFFLENLVPNQKNHSPFVGKHREPQPPIIQSSNATTDNPQSPIIQSSSSTVEIPRMVSKKAKSKKNKVKTPKKNDLAAENFDLAESFDKSTLAIIEELKL